MLQAPQANKTQKEPAEGTRGLDIVERLRDGLLEDVLFEPDILDAADEIVRLRDEVSLLREQLASIRVSTGHTGNQWFTIPEPPAKDTPPAA